MNQQQSHKWFGQPNFGKILCCDIDGVILTFDGWKGGDVFGQPIDGASWALNELKNGGWTIYLFTSRLVTVKLWKLLHTNNIPFDDINGRKGMYFQSYDYIHGENDDNICSWKENPVNTSIKPIASVYLDDMNFENEGKNYDREKWEYVVRRLRERFQ